MGRLKYLPFVLTGMAVAVPLTVAFMPVGAGAAPPPEKQEVTVVNTAANPVPVTGSVSGTVAVSNFPATQAVSGNVGITGTPNVNVAGPVDVRTSSSDHAPYQQTIYFNPSASVCTQFVCTVSFDPVPAGKRLVVTYASALFSLSSGGGFPSVELSVDGGDSPAILLPEPAHHGLDEYSASGPVTFYVESGHRPALLLEGVYVIPSSNTAHAAVVGYLVPAT